MLDGPPDGAATRRTLERIRTACAEVGFLVVTGHGVSPEILADGRDAARRFFALSRSEKLHASPRRWNPSSPNVYRGYFPSSAGGKEGLDLGDPRIEPGMHDLNAHPYLEPNRLPVALDAAWHEKVGRYFDALFALGQGIVRAMVASLGGDSAQVETGFVRPRSISTLRFNFYPGLEEPVEISNEDGQALSCEAHVDSGLITILHQCDRGGLQVRDRDRKWHDVPPDASALVVNTGRALQRAVGGAFGATHHRVLHSRETRLSIPFFFEPTPDLLLEPKSFGLDLPTTAEPVAYETFLVQSMAKFAEYDR